MREILFRGKIADTGKWVYWSGLGRLSEVYNGRLMSGNVGYSHWAYECIYLDDKTVGQYTGLTDKNGKRVFEGDILRIAKKMDGMGHYYSPPLEFPVNVVVKWDLCAWTWETICEDKWYPTFPNAWCYYECEVIGNIHDHPELLKEVPK